jgi:hypothetical protein
MRNCHPWILAVLIITLFAGPSPAQDSLPASDPIRLFVAEKTLPFRLLASKSVQAELKLDDDQLARLRKLLDTVRAAHKDELAKAEKKIIASEEKAWQYEQTVMKDLCEAAGKVLKPEQATRFRQIVIQARGLAAFFLRDVDEALHLTPEQKKERAAIVRDFEAAHKKAEKEAYREAEGDENKNDELLAKKSIAATKEAIDRMTAVLTDEQRKAWKTLVGEPSAFAASLWTKWVAQETISFSPFPPLCRVAEQVASAPKLHEELKLSEEQAGKLAEVPGEVSLGHGKRLIPLFGQIVTDRMEMIHLLDVLAEEARTKALADILKPPQARRLKQLEKQVLGLELLEDRQVLRSLRLTPEQHAEIVLSGLIRHARAQGRVGKVEQEAKGDLDKKEELTRQSVAELNREALGRTAKLMRDKQEKVWGELVGELFDFRGATDFTGSTEFSSLAALQPVFPAKVYLEQAAKASGAGKYQEAATEFEEATRLAPDSPQALVPRSFFLATCPDAKYRDGKQALELAQHAYEKVKDKEPPSAEMLDALAAAHAELGKFDTAVKYEARAIEEADDYMKKTYEERLKLYKDGKPYRAAPMK